jgi:hypothetical protein
MMNCASTIASVAMESSSGISSSDETSFALGRCWDTASRSSG